MSNNPFALDFTGLNEGLAALGVGLGRRSAMNQQQSAAADFINMLNAAQNSSMIPNQTGFVPGVDGSGPTGRLLVQPPQVQPPTPEQPQYPAVTGNPQKDAQVNSIMAQLQGMNNFAPRAENSQPAGNTVPDFIPNPTPPPTPAQSFATIVSKYGPVVASGAIDSITKANQAGEAIQHNQREDFLRSVINASPNYSADDKAYLLANPDQFLALRKYPLETQKMQLDILKTGGELALQQRTLNNPPAPPENELYQIANGSVKHPTITSQMARSSLDSIQADKMKQAIAMGEGRAAGFASYRTGSYIDVNDPNKNEVSMTAKEVADANKTQPGRFMAAKDWQSVSTKMTAVNEVKSAIEETRAAMNAIGGKDFSPGFKSQLGFAMKSEDPGILRSLLGSANVQSMTPEEQNYLATLPRLKETAMGMKQALGIGGSGSDSLRKAMTSVVINESVPIKAYSAKLLDNLDKTVDVVRRTLPTIKNINGDMVNSPSAPTNANVTQPAPKQATPMTATGPYGHKITSKDGGNDSSTPSGGGTPAQGGKPLNKNTAMNFYKLAKGDPVKARAMAQKAGFSTEAQ